MTPKTLLIGNSAPDTSMEQVMAVYPRHKVVVDEFIQRGVVLGIGPFIDRSGNLAIFTSREAAEEFVQKDPFILEGLIASFELKEWLDPLLGSTESCRDDA